MANFVSFNDAQTLMGKIGQKFDSLAGAYIPRGSSTFALLPATPTASMAGYVYNVTDNFTTDSRFAEGSGKAYPAGSNVVVVDNSTFAAVTPVGSENPTTEGWYELDSTSGKYTLSEDTEVDSEKTYYAKTTLIQFDVLSGFVDLSGIEGEIENLVESIAPVFNTAVAYSGGSYVMHDGSLYKLMTDHAAGDSWESVTAFKADVVTYIKESNNAIKAVIADDFRNDLAYSAGDVVYLGNVLYKFTADKPAGTWDPTKATRTTVADLVNDTEPDSLTSEQIADLIGLLD